MTRVVPPEWAPHQAMWLGFPSHGELWEQDLEPAQDEVAALARALAGSGAERVRLLVDGEQARAAALTRLSDVPGVEIVLGKFGDIWLRDTGPIFLQDGARAVAAGFRFNGWGGKYELEHDGTVAEQIAAASGAPLERHDFILEGGAIDHDGFGTVLTTRQCLLNPNRNPGWTEADVERALAQALGARKVIWLDEGLLNDHTDGHVDNLARFVAPGVVACPSPWGANDPNAAAFDAVARALSGATDARGSEIQVVRVPSPGLILDEDGEPLPCSHMNFLVANEAVIVPTYEDAAAALAVEALKTVYPERAVVALPSKHILTGGGSFHCITQQEPAGSASG